MSQPLLGRRDSARKIPAAGAVIDGVAIGGFENDVEVLTLEVVNDFVEPCEVENAGDSLALGPAGLKTDSLDAKRFDEMTVFAEVGEVAVEDLASDRPVGRPDFARATRPQRPHAFQIDAQRRPDAVGGSRWLDGMRRVLLRHGERLFKVAPPCVVKAFAADFENGFKCHGSGNAVK